MSAGVEAPLVRQFDLLATAPGGVGRLRELILTLAVQGKLVPQEAGDEPASVLLQRILAENNKRDKTFSTPDEDEIPFELPFSWEWSRFGTIANIASNLVSPTAFGSAWQVAPDCIEKGTGRLIYKRTVAEAEITSSNHRFVPGQILYSKIRPSLSKAVVVDFPGLCSADMYPIDSKLNTSFLHLYILSRPFLDQVVVAENRVKMPKLNQEALTSFVVPVPPLAEQSRIVTRVEELMHLCDALEHQRQLETAQHAQLLNTLLGTLTDCTSPDELAANWQRVSDHFDLLLDRPEAVDALEQTILQLAVRGLLVPQDPADEPASVLLQRIRAGKSKQDKPLPEITDEEKSFDLKEPWIWTRVGDIVEMLNGYAFKSEWFKPAGTRLLRNLNISHGRIDWSQPAFVDSLTAASFSSFELKAGDIVLSLDRPIISTGLKYAVVKASDLPCLLLQRVARLSPYTSAISADFFVLWLQSDLFMRTIDPGRSNGVPHISTKQVANLVVGLPPLAEQTRIVARVTQLRHLCTTLRQRLAARQTTQRHLAEALVEV
jgi:type I restriction enzyme S subunit